MGFPVYDYRKDIRNILVTPQIRARFLRMEVGQVNQGHTHDLGHEVFLILQGRAEFEIDGQKEVLGPGSSFITGHALVVDGGLTIQLQETVVYMVEETLREHGGKW